MSHRSPSRLSAKNQASDIGRNEPCPCGSGRKFKRCHIGQSLPSAPKQDLSFLPDAPRITFAELKTQIAATGQDPLRIALSIVARARKVIPPQKIGAPDNSFHVWGVGILVLAALSLPHNPAPDGMIASIDQTLISKLLHRVAGLSGDDRVTARSPEEVHAATRLGLLRILAQSSLQGDAVSHVYRTLFLLELVDDNGVLNTNGTHYDSLFRAKFDASVLDYLTVLFALYASSLKSDGGDLRSLYSATARQSELGKLTRTLLSEYGCEHSQVADMIEKNYSAYRAEGLAQAFFTQRPFIIIDENLFVLPLPPFSHFLAVSSPIYTALALAREESRAQGHSEPWKNIHSTRMGQRFEKLVGSTLSTICPADKLVGEYEYHKKHNDRSPDFLVFGDDGSVVLVQAKLKQLTAGAFFGFDFSAFESDAQGALAETVWKTIRYLFRLERATEQNQRRPGTEAISDRVRKAPRIFLLGVVPAMPSVFRVPQFRSILKAAADAKLNSEEQAWWQKNEVRFVGWHLLDWSELASFASVSRGREMLLQQLVLYTSELGQRGFINPDGMRPSFRDWYLLRNQDSEHKPLEAHRIAFEQFYKAASSIFAFHDGEHQTPKGSK